MLHVVVLWLVNEEGALLVAQRSHNKRQDPGVWGPSVTGKVEPGESREQALTREVDEELGLAGSDYDPTFLTSFDFHHPDGEVRRFDIYSAEFPHAKTPMITIAEDEVAGIDWRSIVSLEAQIQDEPESLVPSAGAVWPITFAAIRDNASGTSASRFEPT